MTTPLSRNDENDTLARQVGHIAFLILGGQKLSLGEVEVRILERAAVALRQSVVSETQASNEDAELWEWAATHPEAAMREISSWWATAGAGGREIRFEFRNVIRSLKRKNND